MADLVGHTLGAYRIEARLGAGGMGDVYRAMHTRLGRPAAIKVLHPNQAADATFQARFLREARAAAALSHPNIVEVFDFGEQDGFSYLVMELVPDGSLRTLLQQRAQGAGWTLGLGVGLVRQAAEGLAYAHAHGMVHRDIKPDNLLLQRLNLATPERRSESTESYLLKISDFGLARLLDEAGELTVTGMVMGTPTYMSPEQCQGGDLDGRSDLYSLGVVLYEVATGAPPFRVKSLSEAVFKHISMPPEPPRTVQPDLPPALEEVILRCLAKHPEDRYASGLELADALDGALGDTELRTIITSRRSNMPVAPTPVNSSSAPAYVSATPTGAPTPIQSVSTPAAFEASSDAATVAATSGDSSLSLIARVAQAARSGAAQVGWPRSNDVNATIASSPARPSGNIGVLLARPQARAGMGLGALALITVLIIALSHGGQKTTNNTSGLGSHSGHAVATATPHSTPAATATPQLTVKYQNSLQSAAASWPRSSRSYFSNGGYELNGNWISFAPVKSTSDGTYSVRMRQLSGPADQFYGLVFRAPDSNHFYFYGIDQNQQWTFTTIQNGNSAPIVASTTASQITAGYNSSNTISVSATGSHFVFFINGAQVGEATDTTFAAGSAGLINTSGNMQVVYNDFTVSVPAQ